MKAMFTKQELPPRELLLVTPAEAAPRPRAKVLRSTMDLPSGVKRVPKGGQD